MEAAVELFYAKVGAGCPVRGCCMAALRPAPHPPHGIPAALSYHISRVSDIYLFCCGLYGPLLTGYRAGPHGRCSCWPTLS